MRYSLYIQYSVYQFLYGAVFLGKVKQNELHIKPGTYDYTLIPSDKLPVDPQTLN
jgi:hypothetical protein